MFLPMSMTGWTALGALTSKIAAQSNDLSNVLSYSTIAIAICTSVAALTMIAQRQPQALIPATLSQSPGIMFKALADQTLFAEIRARSLALAERFEKTDGRE